MELEDLPKPKPAITVGENIELLSIADLEQRIQALESEIERTRATMAAKQASRSAADALFRN